MQPKDRQRIFIFGFCVSAADVSAQTAAEVMAAYNVICGVFPPFANFVKVTETPEGTAPATTLAEVTTLP
jgi:hypothetical protein